MMRRMDHSLVMPVIATVAPAPLRIEVIGDCLSGLPLRVLGVFAAQDLVVPAFSCRVIGECIRLHLTLPTMPDQHAAIALARIEAMVGVQRVRRRRA